MRTLKLSILLLALTIFAAACGGGENPQPTPAPLTVSELLANPAAHLGTVTVIGFTESEEAVPVTIACMKRDLQLPATKQVTDDKYRLHDTMRGDDVIILRVHAGCFSTNPKLKTETQTIKGQWVMDADGKYYLNI